MVYWADGENTSRLSGYDPSTKRTVELLYSFAQPEQSIDVGAVTRIGYHFNSAPGYGGGNPLGVNGKDLIVTAKPVWSSADYSSNPGKRAAVTLFIAPASALPDNPTPASVVAAASRVVRSLNSDTSTGMWTNRFYCPATWFEENTKYWVAIVPTMVSPWSTPSLANDQPPAGYTFNSLARSISFWTNRSAGKPTITSPANNTVINPGQVLNLAFTPNDPDAMPPDDPERRNRDVAGVCVQYAALPTPENPNPEWRLLPYRLADGREARGAYSYRTIVPAPSEAPYDAKIISDLALPIRGGTSTPPAAGQAALPSGTWQIRVATVGYGHPFPLDRDPTFALNRSTGPTGPYVFDGANWSDPVRVTVVSQVPNPTPVRPVGGLAIAEDKPVVLSWKYRNTAIPAVPQAFRRVQVREVGQSDWVNVAQSGGSDASVQVGAPVPAVANVFVDLCNSTANFSGIAAGSSGPEMRDGFVTMRRISASWPDETKKGPVILSRGNIAGVTRAARVKIKGSRIMAASPTNPDPLSIRVTFNGPNGAVAGFMESQVNAENTWSDTPRTLWETTYVTAAGFTSITVTCIGMDNLNVELGLDEIRVDLLEEGFDFGATKEYEWRVQVADATEVWSDFSLPARFWIVPAPGEGGDTPVPSSTIAGATLGCGVHRVYVYRRGGKVPVGEITDLSSIMWERVRDDISTAQIVVSDWGIDCGNLLARLEPWAYELVIFRNNGFSVDRVWEGPITLLTYEQDKVTVHAKDMMGYLYRRIIKQEMNDSRVGRSIVARALEIVQNCFAPDDPNVLAHVQPLTRDDDPNQYRNTPPYSRTAFEEIDDMASNSGLDYTVVGRAILIWGTKHRIGTLPEFRDTDFLSPPIVSVYGMSMANRYAVSDGNGLWGEATRGLDPVSGNSPIYGLVEMLSSSWASDSEEDSGTYTAEGKAKVIASFKESSERSIDSRYPAPVVVRVPDNTTLNPDAVISIQQLVPGVAIPLRATSTLREVVGTQKLDKVSVSETEGVETVSVTMSPFSRDDASMEEETE